MNKIYDYIVVGSGPAGLAAAIYGSRAGLDGIVIETKPISGGQVLSTYEVDNYPGLPGISGIDLGTKMREHADKAGSIFVEGRVIDVRKTQEGYLVVTEEETYCTKGLIVATGAEHRHLGVPGEEELTGMGVSYCATCDGAFFKNRTVAVVGGGDVAVEDAIFLARTCEQVYVIHRRDELRSAKVLQDKLFSLNNVEILWNHVVDEIVDEDGIEHLLISNVKSGMKQELNVDGVFVAVGITPSTTEIRHLADCDADGYFIAGEDCRTSTPFVYAAGDVRTKNLRQIITAVADGANAITSLQEDLLQKCNK